MRSLKIAHARLSLRTIAAFGFVAVLFVGMSAFASTSGSTTTSSSTTNATPPSSGNAPPPPPSTGNAALDAALKVCAASVAKDAHGGPDHAAMDACMKQKGFTPPQGGPPPGGQGGHNGNGAPPPAPSGSSSTNTSNTAQ